MRCSIILLSGLTSILQAASLDEEFSLKQTQFPFAQTLGSSIQRASAPGSLTSAPYTPIYETPGLTTAAEKNCCVTNRKECKIDNYRYGSYCAGGSILFAGCFMVALAPTTISSTYTCCATCTLCTGCLLLCCSHKCPKKAAFYITFCTPACCDNDIPTVSPSITGEGEYESLEYTSIREDIEKD